MAKGSQLTQLKSALSQAGLSRQSQPGGSSKSGDKKRKRGTVDPAAERAKKAHRLDEINRKLNPFDVKVTKLKHDVGGRNVKGVTGRPGASNQAGLEQVRVFLSFSGTQPNDSLRYSVNGHFSPSMISVAAQEVLSTVVSARMIQLSPPKSGCSSDSLESDSGHPGA